MLKAIGDIFSAVSKRVSGNLGDIFTAGDPKSFLFKKEQKLYLVENLVEVVVET